MKTNISLWLLIAVVTPACTLNDKLLGSGVGTRDAAVDGGGSVQSEDAGQQAMSGDVGPAIIDFAGAQARFESSTTDVGKVALQGSVLTYVKLVTTTRKVVAPFQFLVRGNTAFSVTKTQCRGPLVPGGSCYAEVQFHPTDAGVTVATLVADNGAGPALTTLVGNAIPYRVFSQPHFERDTVEVGDLVVGNSFVTEIRLFNPTNEVALGFTLSLEPDLGNFQVLRTNCNQPIQPHSLCTTLVVYTESPSSFPAVTLMARNDVLQTSTHITRRPVEDNDAGVPMSRD